MNAGGRRTVKTIGALTFCLALLATPVLAASPAGGEPVMVFGIPVDFILFGLTLLGVALFHHRTLKVAVWGLSHRALQGGIHRLQVRGRPRRSRSASGARVGDSGEPVLLLMGFALLSRHFEESQVPAMLPKFLPDDWVGGFMLLWLVFVLSSFLDNIAAALIGGTMANVVFRGKVHIGYLAAIVAASNAGGAGAWWAIPRRP